MATGQVENPTDGSSVEIPWEEWVKLARKGSTADG